MARTSLSSSSRSANSNLDQTAFVTAQPFLSSSPQQLFNFKQLKKNRNILPFYILLGVMLLLLALFVIALSSRREVAPQAGVTPTPTPMGNISPLQNRVNQLRSDLKAADPTRQLLPFPQVDLEFNLD
mgnify:CR=1 FL=1